MNTKSPLFDQLQTSLKEAYTSAYLDHTLQEPEGSLDTRAKLILGILQYHEDILLTSPIDYKNLSAPVTPIIIPGYGYLQVFAQEYGSTKTTLQFIYCDRYCFLAPILYNNLEDTPDVKELLEYITKIVNKQPLKKADLVIKLRDITGYSLLQCKNALNSVNWNLVRAQDYLRHAGTGRFTDTYNKQY